MKKIEDIKEFNDIDTYYEISKIVDEVFQDRVEAHKHLVLANIEIERLNNIIDNAIKGIEDFYCGDDEYKKYDSTLAYKIYHILKGSEKE